MITKTPIEQSQAYRDILISIVGEEMAEINLLPLEDRIQIWLEMCETFDSPEDIYWPENPPPGTKGILSH